MSKTPEEIIEAKRERNRRYYRKYKDEIKNRDSFKRSQKNYTQSEKGKLSQKRNRQKIMDDPIKRERYYQKHKEWRKKNPEKAKASQHMCDVRRRLKKRLASLILTESED